MINKSLLTPIYIQIADEIKKNIENGIFIPGQMLPSEREFCEMYSTSRMTIRQAISQLVNEGILYKERSKGTFVAKKVIEKQMELKSFTQDMIGRGFKPGSKIISFVIADPSNEVKEKLCLKSEEKIFLLNRLRLANDTPMAIEYCHLPVKWYPDLFKYNMQEWSLYEIMLKDYRINVSYANQTIKAVRMSKSQAQILLNKESGFGLMATRTLFTSDNIAVEYTTTLYHPDRYVYNMVLTLDDKR